MRILPRHAEGASRLRYAKRGRRRGLSARPDATRDASGGVLELWPRHDGALRAARRQAGLLQLVLRAGAQLPVEKYDAKRRKRRFAHSIGSTRTAMTPVAGSASWLNAA